MRYPTIIYDEEDDVPSYQDLKQEQASSPSPEANGVAAVSPAPQDPVAPKVPVRPTRGGWSPATSSQTEAEQEAPKSVQAPGVAAPVPETVKPTRPSTPRARGWSPSVNWKPGEEEGYGAGIEVSKPIATAAPKQAAGEPDTRFASADEVVRLASTVENLATTVRALRPAIVLDLELPDLGDPAPQAPVSQPKSHIAEDGSVALESLAFTVKSLASTVQSLASTVGHLAPEKIIETIPRSEAVEPIAATQEAGLVARSPESIILDIPPTGTNDDDVVEEIVESDLNITAAEAAAGMDAVEATPNDETTVETAEAIAASGETSIADEIPSQEDHDDGARQDDTPPVAVATPAENLPSAEIDDEPVFLTESVKPPPPVVTDEPLQITVPELSKLATAEQSPEPEPETVPNIPQQDELAEFDAAVQNPEVSAALAELQATEEAAQAANEEPPAEVTASSTPPDLVALHDQLVQACLAGQLKLVTTLLEAGADPNAPGVVTTEEGETYEGITPIQAAILATMSEEVTPKMLRKQTARIVKVLLSRGALTTENERDLVMHCANHDLGEVIEVLGEHNVRLRRYAFDTIGIALHHGHFDVLRAMTKSGCSVNIMNDRGNRPFLDMCSRTMRSPILNKATAPKTIEDMTDRIKQFVECGLNLEAVDKVGATALMRSIATGNEAMSWALLAAGANPKARMRNGVSVVHLAASSMGASFLRRFLDHTDTYSDLARLRALRLQPDVRALVASSVQQTQQAKADRVA